MNKINNLNDLVLLLSTYKKYLEGKIDFKKNGFPIFKESDFVSVEPLFIIPFYHRNSSIIKEKRKYLISFFTDDKCIINRFIKVFDEIHIYKKYLGVVIPDLTITNDMDVEYQLFLLLLNHLFAAILVVNGIKIVLNTRFGSINYEEFLTHIPINIMCCSSFLGCKTTKLSDDVIKYTSKITFLLPSFLLIYGKEDNLISKKLVELGINFKYHKDYHSLSKENINGRLQTRL